MVLQKFKKKIGTRTSSSNHHDNLVKEEQEESSSNNNTKGGRNLSVLVSFAIFSLAQFVRNSKDPMMRRALQANMPTNLIKTKMMMMMPSSSDSDHDGFVEVPKNNDATMADDVASIRYNPYESRILVTLRGGARCPRPYLIGRISGPAVVKLEWTWINTYTLLEETTSSNTTTTTTTIMEGIYQAPTPGQYFLEIVSLFCDDFFYDLKDINNDNNNDDERETNLNNNTAAKKAMEYNFKGTCLEDSSHNRLTDTNATIWVPETASTEAVTRGGSNPIMIDHAKGYWQRSEDYPTTDGIQPLHTRYQPSSCVNNHSAPCNVHTEVDRFKPFEFQWSEPYKALHNVSSLQQDKQTVVCFVGYSHSRQLWLAAERLNITLANLNVTAGWIRAKFPWQVTPEVYEPMVQPCHKLVVGVGQWSASEKGRSPTLLNKYYEETKAMLSGLKASKNITSQMDVYARPIHYNPLGFLQTICPPHNWRSPLVIDGYNKVIEHACLELGIPFIDVNFVLAPLWDHAGDWCHLDDKVQDAELMYILASVLGVVDLPGSTMKTNSEHDISKPPKLFESQHFLAET